jgi:hypothetical protein
MEAASLKEIKSQFCEVGSLIEMHEVMQAKLDDAKY